MRLFHISLMAVFCLILTSGIATAQISSGGEPASFHYKVGASIPVITMPTVDVEALLAEDEAEEKLGVPFRFGFPHDVSLNLDNSGVWETLDDGGRLWRLAIECPGAYSINIIYDQYRVPDGARFHLYTEDKQMILGAFTSRNNKDHGRFATAPTRGEKVILEYYLPASVNNRGLLSIGRIVHGYKDVFFGRSTKGGEPGFGKSGDCNVNVNCPGWEDWSSESRSVAMILNSRGIRICTGALVNNVRQDQTPYFLSANHCLGEEETWVLMFNYESPTCENIDGPTWMTISGTTLLAANDYSDFALLQLSAQPPPSYNVFYAGWTLSEDPSPTSVCIHHPSGDIKKISLDDDPLVPTDYLAYSGDSHWQVGHWETGTTEPGSSGSPLFDPDHHIVGQLHGGYASCKKIKPDWYGMFSKSWNYGATPETRLQDWLDPDNTGTLALDGMDSECCVGMRGNADGDPNDSVDLMDLLFLVEWLWNGGEDPPCKKEANVDGLAEVDAMDLVYLVEYFWNSGPAPVACEP